MINTNQYSTKSKRIEELLGILTQNGGLTKSQQKELDSLSDEVAEYEKIKYPFKAESLIELIELRRMYI